MNRKRENDKLPLSIIKKFSLEILSVKWRASKNGLSGRIIYQIIRWILRGLNLLRPQKVLGKSSIPDVNLLHVGVNGLPSTIKNK
jgi:hypothetical protein